MTDKGLYPWMTPHPTPALMAPPATPLAAPPPGSTCPARVAVAAQGARILVVDAERLNRSALEDFLRAAGFAVIEFTADGIPGLGQLRDDLPDLVLLDLPPDAAAGSAPTAPAALLQAMQHDRRLREVPVIVLTSHADLAQRLAALQCGAADFLVTPSDPRAGREDARRPAGPHRCADRAAEP